jgi:hypothetical protein
MRDGKKKPPQVRGGVAFAIETSGHHQIPDQPVAINTCSVLRNMSENLVMDFSFFWLVSVKLHSQM